MKLCVCCNRGAMIARDLVWGFPFSWWKDVELVGDLDSADVIFIDFGPTPFTQEVTTLSEAVFNEGWFKDLAHKVVWYSLADFPYFTWGCPSGLKFVLSPLPDREFNKRCNVHPVPLHLCPADFQIQMDRDYTVECRGLDKEYEFGFIGNVTGGIARHMFGGRVWLQELADGPLKGRMFLRNRPGWAFQATWPREHREWMQIMASCRYAFCPAGASTGPRPFWAMQVGCVPIFTDVEHLPFEDEVDWASMSITIPSEHKATFNYDTLPTGDDYEQMRVNAMAFWDEYCWMPNLAEHLKEVTCAYLSQAAQDSSLHTWLSTYFASRKSPASSDLTSWVKRRKDMIASATRDLTMIPE